MNIDQNYAAYRETMNSIRREGNTFPDNEYERLAARDEVDRLLHEADFTPPERGRPVSRETGRPFSFA